MWDEPKGCINHSSFFSPVVIVILDIFRISHKWNSIAPFSFFFWNQRPLYYGGFPELLIIKKDMNFYRNSYEKYIRFFLEKSNLQFSSNEFSKSLFLLFFIYFRWELQFVFWKINPKGQLMDCSMPSGKSNCSAVICLLIHSLIYSLVHWLIKSFINSFF